MMAQGTSTLRDFPRPIRSIRTHPVAVQATRRPELRCGAEAQRDLGGAARCWGGCAIRCCVLPLGLGKLSRRTGQREQARAQLTTATTMYREMGMTYWLEQAEAEMRQLA